MTSINLATEKTQDSILEKVEFASYVVDVDKETYLPKMQKELAIGDYYQWDTSAIISVINDDYIYAFTSSNCIKADRKTMKVVENKYLSTGIMSSYKGRTFVDDGDYIYGLIRVSPDHRIFKMNKATLAITTGRWITTNTYGLPSRIITAGDKLVVGTNTNGAYIIDKTSMDFIGSKNINPSGNPTIDILYGGDKYPLIYMFSRLSGTSAMYIMTWNLTGSVVGAYQSPSYKANNNNGFLQYADDDNFLLTSENQAYALNKQTLEVRILQGARSTSAIDMYLAYMTDGKVRSFRFNINGRTTSITDFKTGEELERYPIRNDISIGDIIAFNDIVYCVCSVTINGTQEVPSITELKDVYQIKEYKKVVPK